MRMRFDGYPNVVMAQQFSRAWLEREFLPLTDAMERAFDERGCDILAGKRMASFFYQPSTRTRMSFEMAMDYLGGRVVFQSENAGEFSSAKKGESFADFLRVVSRYRPDVVVIRYNKELNPDIIGKYSSVPIINAGDREPGQHPTQALLDLRTISKRRGQIDGLKIAMVGDLLNGRTVRSLSYLLGKFKGIQIYFISPESLRMKDDVKSYLHRHGVEFSESNDVREVARHVDAIYQTRTQTENGAVLDRNDRSKGYFTIDRSVVDIMPAEAILMHPLPRVEGVEITNDVDGDPRSVYLTDQIDSGLFTRMALLVMILAPDAQV